ncbi:hypothetical protein EDB81DRAFT_781757 [Dactylonectria macrodidyma]|uniref:Uncharacterized protein n=1 Tax=Dactylonectria macrodidyma TaxID=307937 RepID=A0A9P9FN62_9HYPO|nr:hypothetical protein EDB81DRAFT_781757 [Dactylonectria macrodidyma]
MLPSFPYFSYFGVWGFLLPAKTAPSPTAMPRHTHGMRCRADDRRAECILSGYASLFPLFFCPFRLHVVGQERMTGINEMVTFETGSSTTLPCKGGRCY